MCSRLLRHEPRTQAGPVLRIQRARVQCACCGVYERTLRWALAAPLLMMFVLLVTVCLNVFLYIQVPKGFFPTEDTGVLVGGVQADQSISFQSMSQKMVELMKIVKSDPAVHNVVGFTGGGQRNGGFMFVALKPLAERGISTDGVIAALRGKLGEVAGRTACSCRRRRISASAAGRAIRPISTPCRATASTICAPGAPKIRRGVAEQCPSWPTSTATRQDRAWKPR